MNQAKKQTITTTDGGELVTVDCEAVGDYFGHPLLGSGAPRWIPAEESLPDEHKIVLVRCGKAVGLGCSGDGGFFMSERIPRTLYGKCDIPEGPVTHWMPIPWPEEE